MRIKLKASWSLMTKLVGWGGIMALIVLGLSAYAMYRLALMQGYSEKSYTEAVIPLQECAQLAMTLASIQSKINDHVATSESERMAELEAEIASAFKEGSAILQRLGSDPEVQRMKVEWEDVTQLMRNAIIKSKSFRKFEALSAVNSGKGLKQILALNLTISDRLTRTVYRAEKYQKESRALGKVTTQYMVAASAAAVLLSVLVGILIARSIGRPLRTLSGVAARISEGDLTVEIPVRRRSDEIGVLRDSFQRMLTSLKGQNQKVLEVVGELSSVSSQLNTTMSELVQTASHTSSSVSEVSSTVAQISQAAKVASNKAKNVVENSQNVLTISSSGSEATQGTVDKISLIRDQMRSIGQAVVTLSEQSRAIDEIVSSVQDLADQSNLLAVNASIEAARAGDQGRGFAVVSQEIKTLADESRKATDQIRTILDDTRKWVSTVVMATEQGTKAVESGVEQSVLAGDSIKSLVERVASSAQEASVIAASTDEQLAGIEQASSAMVQIEKAMHQNLEGTSQVEAATKKLESLGITLNELVKYYKV
jgi:methyl-accepting chemotaxis protein